MTVDTVTTLQHQHNSYNHLSSFRVISEDEARLCTVTLWCLLALSHHLSQLSHQADSGPPWKWIYAKNQQL